jgi:hypothetical protein
VWLSNYYQEDPYLQPVRDDSGLLSLYCCSACDPELAKPKQVDLTGIRYHAKAPSHLANVRALPEQVRKAKEQAAQQ